MLFAEDTNITLIFLVGEHNLSHDLTIDCSELFLQGEKESEQAENGVVVNFNSTAKIHFEISNYLAIYNITLRSEIGTQKFEITSPTIHSVTSLLHGLTLDRMNLAVRQAFSVQISECMGSESELKFIKTMYINVERTNISGDGSRLGKKLHEKVGIQISYDSVSHLSVHKSQITNFKSGIHSSGNNVKVFINSSKFEENLLGVHLYDSQGATIVNTMFERNTFGVHIFNVHSQGIIIKNTQIIGNDYGVFSWGGSYNTNIRVLNSTITKSTNFGLLLKYTIHVYVTTSCVTENGIGIVSISTTLTIQDTSISNNTVGMVIPTANMFVKNAKDKNSSIENCTFSSNSLAGMILINSKGKTEIKDSSFHKNKGTPIIAYQSVFELMGETVFRDNTADRGGGLALYNSTVTFGPGSNTQFVNNTALEYGGAIYIVSLPAIPSPILIDFENVKDPLTQGIVRDNTLLRQSCFYSVNERGNTQVAFRGNTATLGGLSIFGPTLYTDDCSVTKKPFRYDKSMSTFLHVSSFPSRVCFCVDDKPKCKMLMLNETRYPGEKFFVPVVLTGYRYGRVKGPVYTNVVGHDYTKVIDENEHVQLTALSCTNLKFTMSVIPSLRRSSFTMELTAHDQFTPDEAAFIKNLRNIKPLTNDTVLPCAKHQQCIAFYTTPIYVNVTLEDCPMGFELRDDGTCDCDQAIASLSTDETPVTCEIRNQIGYITRSGTIWIGVATHKKNTAIYYWHRKCPRNYCNSSKISVDLEKPDTQCNQNRGGVLCGRCPDSYSLQLGNSNCVLCDNSHLTILLIVFAVLGILLVVFISVLDLTVANGTINGLIFYANVAWRNNAILFSFQDRKNIGYYITTLPIAWINLDFGIETCFSAKLDQLTKIGLQFVFPVYIWCIAGLIILICHYSTRATKLFGNNSVAVLATLFLLSYGKLFKNITDVFTYADLRDWNNTVHSVWALDGNVSYDDPRHIGLIVVALIFFLLFWLPFTFTLLVVPFLRAKSNLKLLKWINKLHPFFDTFYGPFKLKKRHQVWTGILLLSRVLMLVVFALSSTTAPYANILLMTIIATLLLVYSAFVGLLYKSLHVSFLEMLYLVNLIFLGETFLFFPQSYFKKWKFNPVPAFSLCVALFQVVCILVLHIVKRLMAVKNAIFPRKQENTNLAPNEPTVHIVDLNQYSNSGSLRESLLSDS